jgi:hypothetical protein
MRRFQSYLEWLIQLCHRGNNYGRDKMIFALGGIAALFNLQYLRMLSLHLLGELLHGFRIAVAD